MEKYRQMIDKHVVARCATDGAVWGEGIVFAYAEKPTFIIRRPDGTSFTWVSHLCEVVDDETGSPCGMLT